MSPKIAFVDTVYPEFLDGFESGKDALTYDQHLDALMNESFGTFDAWSRTMKGMGWDCIDIVGNSRKLNAKWLLERRGDKCEVKENILVERMVREFDPDVLFIQDASFFSDVQLEQLRARYIVAAQISCPMPPKENVSKFHVVFTSFPHYVAQLKALGVPRVVYSPLAFDPVVLDRVVKRFGRREGRDIDVAFVGGVGRSLHWDSGTTALERVASAFGPRFHWYGYGRERLLPDSPLHKCYRGTAWGLEMYDVYRRAKIVVNRHGEVAEGWTNCMRTFEATGCGATLVTEESPNIDALFPEGGIETYRTPDELVLKVDSLLRDDNLRKRQSSLAEFQTTLWHSYSKKMIGVDRILRQMLSDKVGERK